MATKTILGISPGTRVVGLAVIMNGELVEWKVKSFKDKWSKEKQAAIISVIARMIDHYGVQKLSIKKIDPLKSSAHLDSLLHAIEALAHKMRIIVKYYSLNELEYEKRSGIRDGKAKLTERIAEKHPELQREYLLERNNRTEYYTKMFEAIAMAERCRES